jgi:hypothetical protein
LTGTLTPNPPAVQQVPPPSSTTAPDHDGRDLLHYRQNRCPRRAPRQRMTEEQGPRSRSMLGHRPATTAPIPRTPRAPPASDTVIRAHRMHAERGEESGPQGSGTFS